MSMLRKVDLRKVTVLGSIGCLLANLAHGTGARADNIAPCNANSIGQMSTITKVIDKRAPGSASSSREFKNSFTFVAPLGYMIASVDVHKKKGGSNASYSEKWLPAGGSFSSRTQSQDAYQENLNVLAGYETSTDYGKAYLDYASAGSQMSNWYNQVSSGGQGSYEFTMSVSPNSLSDGLWDAYQDVVGRYQVTLGLRCVGTANDQRLFFRNTALGLIQRYHLAKQSGQQPNQQPNQPPAPQPGRQPEVARIDCGQGRLIGRFGLRSGLNNKLVRGGVKAEGTLTSVGAFSDQLAGWESFDIYDLSNKDGLNGGSVALRSVQDPSRWLSIGERNSLQLAAAVCTTSTKTNLFNMNRLGDSIQLQSLVNGQWVIQRSNNLLYANANHVGGNVPQALLFKLVAGR